MITAGQLRDRITFERLDEDGDEGGDWVEHCEVWAFIEPQRSFQAGAERVRGGVSDGIVPVRVHVRRSALTLAVTTAMRIRQGSGPDARFYNITTPPQDLDGTRQFLSVMAGLNAPA